MGMKIDNTAMIQLLPEWMRDDEANRALSTATDKLISLVGKRIKTLRIWDQLGQHECKPPYRDDIHRLNRTGLFLADKIERRWNTQLVSLIHPETIPTEIPDVNNM